METSFLLRPWAVAVVLLLLVQFLPACGVYAGYVLVGGETFASCTNVGVAPTFDRAESRVEAHLLDFHGDLYGRVVDVEFAWRIRDEKRFSGVDDLKEQIRRDVEQARLLTRKAQ